jgi:hypothetical protein
MKYLVTLFCCIIFFAGSAQKQEGVDSIRHRVFLIGDGGELFGGKHPVIDWLSKNVDWNDTRNLALFLGDNVYPIGLPTIGEPGYEDAKLRLDYQINLVKGKKAKSYFIPGNHDWKQGKIGGWLQNNNQVDYINGLQMNNVEAWPHGGCPGPIEVEVDSQLVVILMDSQWFLYVHEKPGPGSSCSSKTLDEFTNELNEIISKHPNQLVVLAMHHPIYSVGVHGGAYTLRQHIFPLADAIHGLYIPLPIIGSIYPIARGVFGNVQDINHPAYRSMAKAIEDILKNHSNVITAAGHDHSLQLLQKDSVHHIVSGAASKLTRIKASGGKDVFYATASVGFGTIEITKSGKVSSKFYTLSSKNLEDPSYGRELKTIKKGDPPAPMDSIAALPDSISWVANPKLHGSAVRNWFIGNNYRKEWTQAVTVEVLDMGKEQGGLKPEQQGGGKQTRSLRLKDTKGKEWVLRSIQKFPEAAIPPDMRYTIAKDIVEQGISASYPYASLSYSTFARAVGIPALKRKLVFVPNDPRLEKYSKTFANSLAIFEEREPGTVTKTYNSEELAIRLVKDNDDHVDQRNVLRARLLDNFIMDFDRHEDQWRWATRDTGKGKIYYPIPRDHDQAFFTNQGLLPKFVRKPWMVPEIQGFRANPINIKTFNRPARNFDRFFLTELSAKDWQLQIDTFLAGMTDEVIEAAMRQQPREIYNFSAPKIAETLKKRREYFRKDMMEYYKFLSKDVSVVGSDDREFIHIVKNPDYTVKVTVNKITKEGEISSLVYDRTFVPEETEEINIYALGDNDRFLVEGGETFIKIRLIGGSGEDEFVNRGSVSKPLIYDVTFEKNVVVGAEGFHSKFSSDPQVNRYNRLYYKYDIFHPSATVGYNVDDGLFLGGKVEVIRQGFRKEPYSTRYFLMGQRAITRASYIFRFEADFMRVLGNHDLIVRADMRAPINNTNYFGLGNETIFDETKPGSEKYYRARYDILDVSVLGRRQLQSWMRVAYGPTMEYFHVEQEENVGRFVSVDPALNKEDLYKGKTYAGALFHLDINTQNNKVMPIRGLVLDMNVKPIFGMSGRTSNQIKMDFDMRIFASLFNLPRLVWAHRLGYGNIWGDFEFPQAYHLGGTDNLRGYRKDRFSGKKMLFYNTELRFKIDDFSTYLFPGSLGVLVFNDVGRVWMEGESSKDWHVGNGVGVWVAPVRRFVLTASVGRSKEEKALPLLTFGYQF